MEPAIHPVLKYLQSERLTQTSLAEIMDVDVGNLSKTLRGLRCPGAAYVYRMMLATQSNVSTDAITSFHYNLSIYNKNKATQQQEDAQ